MKPMKSMKYGRMDDKKQGMNVEDQGRSPKKEGRMEEKK